MMRWYALAAAVVALDQASKWTVLAQVEYGRSIPVLPFLYWTHTCNTGVAFSMFQGYGSIFALVAVVVAAYLAFEIWRWRSGLAEGAAYGLILGGALGNLADRLQHGCVVDFVHVYYGWFNFPVFNVADSAITLGAASWIGFVVIESIRGAARRNESAAS